MQEIVRFKAPVSEYTECFFLKCYIERQNEVIQKKIDARLLTLERRFGNAAKLWYSKLKEDKLLNKEDKSNECIKVVGELYEIALDETRWKEFLRFLEYFRKESFSAEAENNRTLLEFNRIREAVRGQLRKTVAEGFKSDLAQRNAQILKTDTISKSFDSELLGTIEFEVQKTNVDYNVFEEVADAAIEEQWKYNSLNQGAMPYSYCYGSSNYCGDYGCSKISVKSGSSDVLVTIKDSSGDVYRHAYIRAGRQFIFNVVDGSYQVFFYSGKGWNPNKVITKTKCGTLRGGFVSGEDITKDSYIDLYSQIMNYELVLQQSGNLVTKPSSKNEAF